MPQERWKEVDGWPYEVSDQGRVRRSEPGPATHVGKILRPQEGRTGYLRLHLYRDGKSKIFFVHVLVAEAFMGPRPKGHNVNHKNGDKGDPRLENLEWKSPRDNQLHAIDEGLYGGRGEEHGRAKLAEEEVVEIRHKYNTGNVTQQALADRYGVSQPLISKIVKHECWTEAGGPMAEGVIRNRSDLTGQDIRDMRKAWESGSATMQELADRHDRSRQIIRDIVTGKTWKHVE